ncbi:MAG: cytochrome c biogenesis protein CcsA [Myxococcota bacterium]
MIVFIASAVVMLYIVSATLYLTGVVRDQEPLERPAFAVLCVGMVLHLGSLVGVVLQGSGGAEALLSIQQGLSILSLLLGVGFLALRLLYQLKTVASFIVPLMMLLQATSVLSSAGGSVEPELRSTLLAVHIGSALVGTAAFVLAAMTGVIYLIQEHNLKKKNFGPLFNRLPSVGILDRINLRIILFGFPVYTLAIALGGLWAWEQSAALSLQVQYVFALLSWLVYAGILHARVTAGWRGRRAALLSLVGLVGLSGVLVSYLMRGAF